MMKYTINKRYTSIFLKDKVKKEMQDFLSEFDKTYTFTEWIKDQIYAETGLSLSQYDMLSCKLEAFPGGSYYNDNTWIECEAVFFDQYRTEKAVLFIRYYADIVSFNNASCHVSEYNKVKK